VYLKQFQSTHSTAHTSPLHDILTYLFEMYGDISDDYLQDVTDKLQARVFDITHPILLLFNEVKDLKLLSIAANVKYSERQLFNIGVQCICNYNDSERALEEWLDNDLDERT